MELPQISIIFPCRNEEKTLGRCLKQARQVLSDNGINGEIIVSDSSTDRSPEIAKQAGVILIKHNKDGYGNAYLEAFKIAGGKYLFLADADGTYDINEIPNFLHSLEAGADLVIGNRFAGRIEAGAMPWSHRHLGKFIFRLLTLTLFKAKIHDIHCGMRAISRPALDRLNLRTAGMEFASEMMIKAIKRKLTIAELPINYYRRQGQSKLKTMADGWRHLRFILLYSPMFLFFWPGTILTIISLTLFSHVPIERTFLASSLMIFGYQLVMFSLFATTYARTHLDEKNDLLDLIHRNITIEKAIIGGILLGLAGVYLAISYHWPENFSNESENIKNSIVALTMIIIGLQTIFSSFILSILGIKEK